MNNEITTGARKIVSELNSKTSPTPKEKAIELITRCEIALDMSLSTAFDPSNGKELTEAAKLCAEIGVKAVMGAVFSDREELLFWTRVRSEIIKHKYTENEPA